MEGIDTQYYNTVKTLKRMLASQKYQYELPPLYTDAAIWLNPKWFITQACCQLNTPYLCLFTKLDFIVSKQHNVSNIQPCLPPQKKRKM